MVLNITTVQSKIEATESHEIRHLDLVNRGTMISFLVSDQKLTAFSRVARTTGGTSRVIDRDAVPNESDLLHCQRNLDPQLFRRRPAAEKNLCRSPVPGLRGNIQCRHFVPGR